MDAQATSNVKKADVDDTYDLSQLKQQIKRKSFMLHSYVDQLNNQVLPVPQPHKRSKTFTIGKLF